jgi:hypothetical protein
VFVRWDQDFILGHLQIIEAGLKDARIAPGATPAEAANEAARDYVYPDKNPESKI